MPFIISLFIIVIAILLYLAIYKVICWMCESSKKVIGNGLVQS